ncbi:hypothetical protein BATDEDRAFT_22304 [Batrachochytrium dendrobatidis JAM81]|uniref:EF-hand domain-containing protein n=2 Tax=Batrachochytrium dendrobatidis TaxID=109871 RepID=F4NTL8_BATDJ|nr:uncharacterized protein BATDEDRAFT_22304 [Batrachochytrium dendrobatidis JAM81]EGF83524.1 hypothetical protein BATDEDRAFT_22304 [Batrachochytrium dendrobatidis JAM81]|eukprot:XP_006675526.1 hypothetical protein BATDEDRAFT_22304 [Batrachochytrium dendrobatidis JAM81]
MKKYHTALIYEIQLKEIFDANPVTPNRNRVDCCFRVLKDLVPKIGTFSQVLGIITEELARSVFSNGLTSTNQEPFIESIPYFSLMNQIDDVRAIESNKTQEALEDLQQRVKFRDYDLTVLYKKTLFLKQEINEREHHEKQLERDIANLQTKVQQYEREKNELRIASLREEEALKSDIQKLQTNLTQSNSIIKKLTMFKAASNDGSDEKKLDSEIDSNKHDLIFNSKGMASYDLYQAKQFQRQFAEILDFQLDDFDASLAQIRKKYEIMQSVTGNSQTNLQNQQVYQKELDDLLKKFAAHMQELLGELKLLDIHIKGLELVNNKLSEESSNATIDSVANIASRKYSGILQISSDNGASFHSFGKLKYCSQCGARPVVCPHQGLHSAPIKLPQGCTHLKFIHPLLLMRTTFNSKDSPGPTLNVLGGQNNDKTFQTEDEDNNISAAFLRIWGEYYRNRNGFKPTLNRTYSLQKLLSFIQEIYDMRWKLEIKYDEGEFSEDTELPTFINFFYKTIIDRYQIEEVAIKAIHDIFHGLQIHESANQIVGIFVTHLSGHEDVIWKYHYMAKKLIYSKSEPMDMVRYRQIIFIIYPNQPREMYDQMELEYIAYCKNKVSKESMDDHLVHMLHTGIEPNFKFFFRCFQKFDYQKKGYLAYEDFDEALTQILPSASNRERRVRYKLAELDGKKDKVTIDRLAHIAAYIIMYSCYMSKWAIQSLISTDFIEFMGGRDSASSTAEFQNNNGDYSNWKS